MSLWKELLAYWDKNPILPKKDFIPAEPNMAKGSKKYYADSLLSNPLYKEVIQRIERDCLELWKNTPIEDVEQRERLFMHFKVLKQIDTLFRRYIQDVDIEEHNKNVPDYTQSVV